MRDFSSFGRRWAPALSAQPRQTAMGTQPGALPRPRDVITRELTQPVNGRVEGNDLLHGQGLSGGQSVWLIGGCVVGSYDDCCGLLHGVIIKD